MFELGTVVYVLGELRSLAQTWPGVVVLLIIVVGLVISLWGESTPMLQKVKAQIYALISGKRRCPNNPNHILDANGVCQWCKHEDEIERRKHDIPPQPVRAKTRIGVRPSGQDQREKDDRSSGVGDDTRCIVGVVITYTWRPQGQLFPIYEGKNFIGRAEISDEEPPRDCDIQIPQDTQMSAEHALILYRQGSCEIIDQETTNGTLVNGKLLKSNQGEELHGYDKIRTGATEWTFITIEPSARPEGVSTSGSKPVPDVVKKPGDSIVK